MKKICLSILLITVLTHLNAQTNKEIKAKKDSQYVEEIENRLEPDKVLHAEPLYIDLIRDLGARKGEKEWNVGLGLTDNTDYDEYVALIEYEWAPIDRLGLEVELPFSLYYPIDDNADAPDNNLNSIKLAAQYSFYVSEKHQTSMALGYIQEFELNDFSKYGKNSIYTGNVYNPFFIAARRWGTNWHSLLYTGPAVRQHFANNKISTSWQINSNVHYMIPGTRNFLGIEFNKAIERGDFDMTIRPQMRVSVADNFLIGIVTGIPINRENERFSSFLRLIYEPKHRAKH